jgi:uncharacterized protein
MESNRSIQVPAKRINVIDALRGFALLGVILIHMLQYFGYTPGNLPEAARFPMFDKLIQLLANHVIAGRFINIFSFLFGLSFFIQMDRASKKGIDFRGRFLWRMVILFIIGTIGTIFTYMDILTTYAFFGIILVMLFPLKKWALVLLTCLVLSGLPLVVIVGFDNITFDRTAVVAVTQPLQQFSEGEISNLSADESNLYSKGSFLESAKDNLTTKTREKLNYQFRSSSRGYITFALFIMGFLVGRSGFFEKVNIRRKKNIILLILFFITSVVIELIGQVITPENPINLLMHISQGLKVPINSIITSTLNDIGSLTQSGVIAMGFIVLYQTKVLGKYLDILSSYGRMGLTNYEIQNFTGAVLFSTWGLGSILGSLGSTELFLLGLIIYSVQILISKQWMKYFLYGPLEWLWRSGTYMKWQPFKKTKTINI